MVRDSSKPAVWLLNEFLTACWAVDTDENASPFFSLSLGETIQKLDPEGENINWYLRFSWWNWPGKKQGIILRAEESV